MKKKHFFVFIKRKNGIHSVKREKVPEIRDFYYYYWVGCIRQSNFAS